MAFLLLICTNLSIREIGNSERIKNAEWFSTVFKENKQTQSEEDI